MKRITPLAVALILFASPLYAQRWDPGELPAVVPYIGGSWFLNGNPNSPCQILQREPDGRALFINENGNRAGGSVRNDRVWIPDWTDGVRQGLSGRIRGDRIVWPDGSYWSRYAR